MELHPDHTGFKFDFSNAFNDIRRDKILYEIYHNPKTIHLYKLYWCQLR